MQQAVLRYFYCDLMGDAAAANVMVEEEVEARSKNFYKWSLMTLKLFLTSLRSGVLK